jgi:serine/threonine protein kinase
MREPVPFGRYLLLERVDVGGMAEVFAARVTDGEGAGRLVAVKRLLPTLAEDPASVAMFLDEARIAVQLDHPSIARVDDLGQHGATYYIAMEYVPGRPLRAVMEALAARGERRSRCGCWRRWSTRMRGATAPGGRSGSSTATCRPRTCCSPSRAR